MTLNYDCGDHEGLVDYVYDEGEAAQRVVIAAHLAICGRCAAAVAALRGTREALAAWTPPAAQLGFRIVSEVEGPPTTGLPRVKWWSQPLPAWAQAAAAVLLFSAGIGLGALRGTTAPAATVSTGVVPAASAVSAQDLAALEQRLRSEMRGEMRSLAAASAPTSATTPAPAPASASAAAPRSGSPTLQQVRTLIAESEQRQQRELTLRTAEVIRDFDTQRRGDLARIQQTFGRLEGATGVEVEQQRQMLNYLMRVSQRPAQ